MKYTGTQRKEKNPKMTTTDNSGYTTRRNKSKDIGERRKVQKVIWTGPNNTNKTGHFKITKENPTQKLVESAKRQISHFEAKETKQFLSKIWKRKKRYGNAEWINNMEKRIRTRRWPRGKHISRLAKSNTQENNKSENARL